MGVNFRKGVIDGPLAVWVLATVPYALAQTTNATCLSAYNFLYNSRGQSPCLIAAYAGGACNGGVFDVPALDVGEQYVGPSTTLVDNCQCSSIFYSVISACGVCQNQTIITWSSWDTNCTTVYVSVYPEAISTGTAIPAWAYVNVSTSDIFNPSDAIILQSSPESTASINQVTQTGAGGVNPTHGSSGAKKSSNTGAIAGGVVSGVIVIALVALLAVFLIRQRKNKIKTMTASSGQYMAAHLHTPGPEMQNSVDGSVRGVGYASPQQQQQQQQQQLHSQLSGGTLPTMPSQRFLYNPNEPSTFSNSPTSSTFASPSWEPLQSVGGAFAAPGAYPGVPEVLRDTGTISRFPGVL